MEPLRPRFSRQAPSPSLAPYVVCYWSLTATAAHPWKARILPDGSNDLIVDLGGDALLQPFVVGAMRRADVVPLSGRVDLLGVRFRPGTAFPFLRVPLHELTDRHVSLEELWGGASETLADALASAAVDRRVNVLERELLGALRRPTPADDLAARAIALMQRTRGGIGVRAAARALGVGERRLERAFDRSVGLSPKRFARVLRFLRAVRAIGCRTAAPIGGAALAHASGYADQPHFIREFRRLAGVTPEQFAAERRVGFVQDDDPLPE